MKLTPPKENAEGKEIRGFLRSLASYANLAPKEAATVSTTDATPTVIWTGELPQNSITIVLVEFVGLTSGAVEAAGYLRRAAFRRPGTGACVQVGTTNSAFTAEVTAGWDVALAVSATTGFIEATVTGAAATSISWRAVVTMMSS